MDQELEEMKSPLDLEQDKLNQLSYTMEQNQIHRQPMTDRVNPVTTPPPELDVSTVATKEGMVFFRETFAEGAAEFSKQTATSLQQEYQSTFSSVNSAQQSFPSMPFDTYSRTNMLMNNQ
jgi:hypothetical protein